MLRLDEEFYNPVKAMLAEKKKVCGGWLQLGSTISPEIMAKAGFDFLMVDLEHAPGNVFLLVQQLQAMKGYNAVPFVRAPWNDMVTIKRILDAGVYGLLVPYVNTKAEAEQAVANTKYPPEGVRGVAPSPRAPGYGMNSKNYMNHANDQILVMTAVETYEAVQNLDEILSVPGLDGIFIGPMDLATSMGHFCDASAPEVQEVIAVIEKKVMASKKFLATVAGDFTVAEKLYNKGYSLVVTMSDSGTLAKVSM
ncbi:MAG: aldolase/citrate lyase family protein, partial [Oscillospiraceae bacterium]